MCAALNLALIHTRSGGGAEANWRTVFDVLACWLDTLLCVYVFRVISSVAKSMDVSPVRWELGSTSHLSFFLFCAVVSSKRL